MSLFLSNLYLFILAVVLAVLEIQIEGEHGWAKNLPTWRPKSDFWLAKIYRKFMSGKDLTGYHLAMFGFVFLIMHLPFFRGVEWSEINEWETLSLFFIFAITWDYLWFIFNPSYPLHKFKAEHIWWHKKWLGPLPLDYYLGILISFILYLPVYLKVGDFSWWLATIFSFVGGTLALTLVDYVYEKTTGKTFPFERR